MNFKIRALLIDKTEEEIREEMASALGRIGKKLEVLIAELNKLKERAALCNDDEKGNVLEEYKKIRTKARLYYWYLIIQRESIGLTNHELLPTLYRIPAL
ncbi:hypothetical protein L0152_22360 [bacterium]|nr:hypothetical protein [bacterium]